jgi:hypothetical protein
MVGYTKNVRHEGQEKTAQLVRDSIVIGTSAVAWMLTVQSKFLEQID